MVNSMFYYELSNMIKHNCIINYLTIVHLIINIKHNYRVPTLMLCNSPCQFIIYKGAYA